MKKKIIGGIIAGIALAGAAAVTYWDYNNNSYECFECGRLYKPTFKSYFFSIHTPGKRLLKCPKCGDRNWHYKATGMRSYLA